MAGQEGTSAGAVDLALLNSLGLPEDEVAVLLRGAIESAALTRAGIAPEQLKALSMSL